MAANNVGGDNFLFGVAKDSLFAAAFFHGLINLFSGDFFANTETSSVTEPVLVGTRWA